MLTELIFALLSLAIAVLSYLKGRAHLIMTEGCGSPLFTGQSQHRPESRRQQPPQKHSRVFAPTSGRRGSGS